MKGRFQKQINPGTAALLILIAFGIVQWVWWRGLVYRAPTSGSGGAPGKMSFGPQQVTLEGRRDVLVETYAGDLEPGDANGQGYTARFDRPTGLALDVQGNLYVADTGNHRIRKITAEGETQTLAGSDAGYADGPVAQARFNAPCGVCAAPDGAVYVADTGNQCIRKIQDGQVTTVIGSPPASADHPAGSASQLNLPCALAYVTSEGKPSLLIADSGAKRLTRYALDKSRLSDQNLPGVPTSVVGAPQVATAIPQSGTLLLGAQTFRDMHVEGGIIRADTKKFEPCLHHPVAVWPLGSGWLVTDYDHGALFLVHNGSASVLAGYCSSGGPIRGSKDSDGGRSSFSTMSGVVADGRRYVYVADTANNSIRRLTIPESLLQP